MAVHVLIDRTTRVAHSVTLAPTTGNTPGHVHAAAEMTAAGLTPQVVTLDTEPLGFRRGRVLANDNSEFVDPPETHFVELVARRRTRVVRWARRNTRHGEILRGEVHFNRSGRSLGSNMQPRPLYQAFVGLALTTTAAAHSDDLLNNTVAWGHIEANIGLTMKSFLADARWSDWEGVTRWLLDFERFYRMTGNGGTTRRSEFTTRQLRLGRDFAEGVLYGRG